MIKTVELVGTEKIYCPKCGKEIVTDDVLFGLSGIAEAGCDDCQTLFRIKMNEVHLAAFELLPWNDEENE